jgi:hypothetical protein
MFLNYRISLSFVEVIERKLTKFVVYLLVEMAAEKRNRAKDAVVEEVIQ